MANCSSTSICFLRQCLTTILIEYRSPDCALTPHGCAQSIDLVQTRPRQRVRPWGILPAGLVRFPQGETIDSPPPPLLGAATAARGSIALCPRRSSFVAIRMSSGSRRSISLENAGRAFAATPLLMHSTTMRRGLTGGRRLQFPSPGYP